MSEESILWGLKNYGYSTAESIFEKSEADQIKDALNKLCAKDSKTGNLLHESTDQIILRSVFRDEPSLFLGLLDKPVVKEVCSQVFPDGYTLQSMNASLAKPSAGEDGIGVHIDSKYPAKGIENVTSLGIAFCVDDFNEVNGATKIWPFSHLSGMNPKHLQQENHPIPQPNIVSGNSGDVIFFLSQTWHSVGKNLTENNRWGIFSFINPWWVRPTWDFRECGEGVFKALSEHQKFLLGFYTQTPSVNSKRNYTKIDQTHLPENYEKAKKFID